MCKIRDASPRIYWLVYFLQFFNFSSGSYLHDFYYFCLHIFFIITFESILHTGPMGRPQPRASKFWLKIWGPFLNKYIYTVICSCYKRSVFGSAISQYLVYQKKKKISQYLRLNPLHDFFLSVFFSKNNLS